MLLDTRYFEQLLKERVLKKGLRFFESGSLEYAGKQQGEDYHFLIDKKVALLIRKKGDNLVSYSCSCQKDDYCEHLAAALFYFQQEALGLSVKKKPKKAAAKRSGKKPKTAFEQFSQELTALLKPYTKAKVLDQTRLDDICEEVLNKKSLVPEARCYPMDLAMLVVLPAVFEVRITGDDTKLRSLIEEVRTALQKRFNDQLNKDGQEQWHRATLASIKNNTILRSDAFLFLAPRLLTFLSDRQKITKLSAVLQSRSYKVGYANRFNKLLIVQLEAAVKSYRLFKMPYPTGSHPSAVELVIAKAELDFCSRKTDVGFNRLAVHYDDVKRNHAFYYGAYLDYILDKAREENKPHIELGYLKKSLIHNVHILPRHLERLIELVPTQELDQVINEIISWLKSKPVPYLFDKVADLLLSTSRLDELIDEIRKYANKFNLLHKVLVKKLPHYDLDTLDLYMEHLLEALNEAGFYHFQQHVVNKLQTYLDQLPEKARRNFIAGFLNRLGRTKQISRYISSKFQLATEGY